MQYPEVKNYNDSLSEFNFVDYERFQRVKDLFQLIRDYDAFPITPVILTPDGQFDVSKRSKQGDFKIDWPNSWKDILLLIDETQSTLREIIGYYKKAVRNKEVIPGENDEHPGDSYRSGDPYDDTVNQALIYFYEFYPRYKTLEIWANLGMNLFSKKNKIEIEHQLRALKIQKLVNKQVADMTGDDIMQLLELYDELKTQPKKD